MKAVTEHAKQRALERWGFELSDQQWLALARSIRAGEHRRIRQQADGCTMYQVIFVRDDASTIRVPVVVAPEGTIITVPPPRRRST